jgi:hypothetical protein
MIPPNPAGPGLPLAAPSKFSLYELSAGGDQEDGEVDLMGTGDDLC